jgi:hypothetical protein
MLSVYGAERYLKRLGPIRKQTDLAGHLFVTAWWHRWRR